MDELVHGHSATDECALTNLDVAGDDAVVGDISYGIDIYAWPVQQIVAQRFPTQTPYFNMVVASLIVVPLAWLSWHGIEKRMLNYKGVLLGHTG